MLELGWRVNEVLNGWVGGYVLGDASGVDENVDSAEVVDDALDRLANRIGVTDIYSVE